MQGWLLQLGRFWPTGQMPPPPPRAPLLETSTGLPGTVWEPSRRQSLDVDTIGGKGCKTSTVNFLAQSGQCTL